MRALRWLALGVGLAAASCPRTGPASPGGASPKVRGIIVSTHTEGHEWGGDAMLPTLREIRELGAGWVAIHPYAAIDDDGRVRYRDIDPHAPPERFLRPIREAHALGLRIAIMPHLAYWGSSFAWRGDIAFDDPQEWARFWREYRAWIEDLAAACREADGFVVGNEMDRTLGHEREWRALIAAVRERTDAPLTYAANWTAYREVPFWDALDVIGIQAYFPVAGRPDAPEEEIEQGWRRVVAEVRDFARERGRRVVFTELGYNRALAAPVRPWAYDVDGPEAEAVQERCLRAALRAVESEPAIAGAFLWKWFPQPRSVGRTFQLATPRLRAVIAREWG
jgi:hypothetical protein